MKEKFYQYIERLQDEITSKLEEVDGSAKFREDIWERAEGGGGRTRVIENGAVFEKGGVNISAVHGPLAPAMQQYFKVGDVDFFACGLSLVIHPKNPMVPTVHANWRYFEMYDKQGAVIDQWFGGGQDLTPYYLFEEDAMHFHQISKNACDLTDPGFYSKFKMQCDEYFWNSHREEARGIGGLFFDYCKATEEMVIEDWFKFVTDVGNNFLEAYVPLVEKRKHLEFSEENRDWQEIRRGRYVEFNLVHDKGTLFGLKTNGRIESILMSLPPHVQWVYDHHPEPGSEEERLLEVLAHPKDWITYLNKQFMNFPTELYQYLKKHTLIQVKGGTSRDNFLNIWMVEVEGRIFARSWNKSLKSWFTELEMTGEGQIKYGNTILNIKGKKLVKQDAFNALIDQAYLLKYTQKENIEYAEGITKPEYADYTMEFLMKK